MSWVVTVNSVVRCVAYVFVHYRTSPAYPVVTISNPGGSAGDQSAAALEARGDRRRVARARAVP
jgi:hypothetical protein